MKWTMTCVSFAVKQHLLDFLPVLRQLLWGADNPLGAEWRQLALASHRTLRSRFALEHSNISFQINVNFRYLNTGQKDGGFPNRSCFRYLNTAQKNGVLFLQIELDDLEDCNCKCKRLVSSTDMYAKGLRGFGDSKSNLETVTEVEMWWVVILKYWKTQTHRVCSNKT